MSSGLLKTEIWAAGQLQSFFISLCIFSSCWNLYERTAFTRRVQLSLKKNCGSPLYGILLCKPSTKKHRFSSYLRRLDFPLPTAKTAEECSSVKQNGPSVLKKLWRGIQVKNRPNFFLNAGSMTIPSLFTGSGCLTTKRLHDIIKRNKRR